MASKRILCIGGCGQLGRHVVKTLQPYLITNVDYAKSDTASHNFVLQSALSSTDNNKQVLKQFQTDKSIGKFDSIVVTAGGWVSGSIKDDDYMSKTNQMIDVNLMPSLLAAHLATKYLNDKGLVVFTGAASVFKEPQP